MNTHSPLFPVRIVLMPGEPTYDATSDTYMDPDAPVVICDAHTWRDIDPMSGRCWECGEQVPGLVRA